MDGGRVLMQGTPRECSPADELRAVGWLPMVTALADRRARWLPRRC
jgi:hypothetical protein